MSPSRVKATVVWFNDHRGYGVADSPFGQVFIHYTEIKGDGFKTLTEGQEIEADIVQGRRGPEARNVIKKPYCAIQLKEKV